MRDKSPSSFRRCRNNFVRRQTVPDRQRPESEHRITVTITHIDVEGERGTAQHSGFPSGAGNIPVAWIAVVHPEVGHGQPVPGIQIRQVKTGLFGGREVFVVSGVEEKRGADLLEIAGAIRFDRRRPGLVQRGQQHRGENSDDCDHDEELDQCE